MKSKRDVVKVEFYNVPSDYHIDEDIDKLIFHYAEIGIDVRPVDPNYDISCLIYARKYIRENGLHALYNINVAQEAVVKKGEIVAEIISKSTCAFGCLPSWNTSTNLLIIDPFIFPEKHDENYFNILCELICYFTNVANINIMTQRRYNDTLRKMVEKHLQSLHKNIRIFITDHFHDRYWIINSREGVSFGTSINGLGKKHSTITPLQPGDVTEIFDEATALQQ